jgi:hypothetical protein
MSQATDDDITIGPSPLSAICKDPRVRAAFRRAERDSGMAFAVPGGKPNLLPGGALAPLPKPAEHKTNMGNSHFDLVRVVVATLLLASIFVGAMLPVLQ